MQTNVDKGLNETGGAEGSAGGPVLQGRNTGAVLLGWSACVTLLVVTAGVWRALCPT